MNLRKDHYHTKIHDLFSILWMSVSVEYNVWHYVHVHVHVDVCVYLYVHVCGRGRGRGCCALYWFCCRCSVTFWRDGGGLTARWDGGSVVHEHGGCRRFSLIVRLFVGCDRMLITWYKYAYCILHTAYCIVHLRLCWVEWLLVYLLRNMNIFVWIFVWIWICYVTVP